MSTSYPTTQYTRDEVIAIPDGFRELEEGEVILATDHVFDHHIHEWTAVASVDGHPHFFASSRSYSAPYHADIHNSTIRQTGKPTAVTRDEQLPIPAGFRELEEDEVILVTDLVDVVGTWAPHSDPRVGGTRLAKVGVRYASDDHCQRIRATGIRATVTTTSVTAPAPGPEFPTATPAVGDGYRVLAGGEVLTQGDEFWSPSRGGWTPTSSVGVTVNSSWALKYRRAQPTALETALADNAGLIEQLTEARARVGILDRTNAQLETSLGIRDRRVSDLEARLRTEIERADTQTNRADSAAGQVRAAVTKIEVRDDLIAHLSKRLALLAAEVDPFSLGRITGSGFTARSFPEGVVVSGNPWIGKTFLAPPASPRDAEVSELKARIQLFESNQVKWHGFWAAFRDLHAIDFHITGCPDGSAHRAYGNLRRAFEACTANPGGSA